VGRVTTTAKGIRGWIPSILLIVIIIGGGVTGGVLVSSGFGAPDARPTLGQVTDLNWSSFSEEGLAYIARTREVRIDLSRPPVDAAALGLPDDGLTVLDPIDNGDVVLTYGLIVNGGGESPGGEKFTVSSIEIETRDGLVTRVSAPLNDVLNFRQTLAALEATAELFGWQPIDTAALFERVDAATRDGLPYDFTFGPADRLGVPIAATASCDPSGYCVVEYDVTPSVR
jgi:hypothetical protein